MSRADLVEYFGGAELFGEDQKTIWGGPMLELFIVWIVWIGGQILVSESFVGAMVALVNPLDPP